MLVVISVMSYLAKRTPKMVRGVMFTLSGCCALLGSVVYLQLVRWTIPNIVPYSYCFGFVAILDIFVLVVLLILIAMNKFGNTAPQEDEANGIKPESDAVSASSRSSGQFSNESDGPKGEIFESIIHEIDENDEETAHGSLNDKDNKLFFHEKAGDLASSHRSDEFLNVKSNSYR